MEVNLIHGMAVHLRLRRCDSPIDGHGVLPNLLRDGQAIDNCLNARKRRVGVIVGMIVRMVMMMLIHMVVFVLVMMLVLIMLMSVARRGSPRPRR